MPVFGPADALPVGLLASRVFTGVENEAFEDAAGDDVLQPIVIHAYCYNGGAGDSAAVLTNTGGLIKLLILGGNGGGSQGYVQLDKPIVIATNTPWITVTGTLPALGFRAFYTTLPVLV